MKTVALIMAGGAGERFWPLSTKEKPKHLQSIVTNEIMLNDTINRVKKNIDINDIYIMTNENQIDNLKKLIVNDFLDENILIEPMSKNTAPCIIYFSKYIRDLFNEATILVVPCDHYILKEDIYTKNISDALKLAKDEDAIVTIGINPSYASTGYGYIEFNDNRVISFKEKPNLETAKKYIESDTYYWNSGIFMFKVEVLLEKAKKHCKDIYENIMNYPIKEAFKRCRSSSIDYEILEKSSNIKMVKGEFIWNDIGTFDVVHEVAIKDENNNYCNSNLVSISSNNSYIRTSKKNVAIIGLNDIIIIETENELLICDKSKAQDVKKVVALLEKDNYEFNRKS